MKLMKVTREYNGHPSIWHVLSAQDLLQVAIKFLEIEPAKERYLINDHDAIMLLFMLSSPE